MLIVGHGSLLACSTLGFLQCFPFLLASWQPGLCNTQKLQSVACCSPTASLCTTHKAAQKFAHRRAEQWWDDVSLLCVCLRRFPAQFLLLSVCPTIASLCNTSIGAEQYTFLEQKHVYTIPTPCIPAHTALQCTIRPCKVLYRPSMHPVGHVRQAGCANKRLIGVPTFRQLLQVSITLDVRLRISRIRVLPGVRVSSVRALKGLEYTDIGRLHIAWH